MLFAQLDEKIEPQIVSLAKKVSQSGLQLRAFPPPRAFSFAAAAGKTHLPLCFRSAPWGKLSALCRPQLTAIGIVLSYALLLLLLCDCQMDAPGYMDKVPANVREGNSKKKAEYEAQRDSVLKAMQQFEGLKI